MKCRAGAGAGVLHVDNWNFAEPHGPECDLAWDHELTLYSSLSCVSEKGRVDFTLFDASIAEGLGDGLTNELLHSRLKVSAKRSHSGTDNVDFAHILPCAYYVCRKS